jgi:small-conductance mechanosensitive channel
MSNANQSFFMEQVNEAMRQYWQVFLDYVPLMGLGLIVLVIAFLIAGWVSSILKRNLNKSMDDPLLVRFLSRVTKIALILVGLLLALRIMGAGGVAAGLLAGAGLSAFVIGFAFKDIAENFLAGIILSFNRPFDLNDTVTVEGYTGQVISLDFRTSQIKTFDGKDIYIPNSILLKQPVTNYTRDGLIRLEFIVGIDYDDNIAEALKLISDTLLEEEEVLKDNPPYAIVDQLATSTVNLRIYFWADTTDYKKGVNLLKGRVVGAVKEALLDKGFGLPADIQELKIYKSDDPFPIRVASGPESDSKDKASAESSK